MMLAQETSSWLGAMDWPLLVVLLQVVVLVYLLISSRRIARNQVEMAEYLKKMLEKDE